MHRAYILIFDIFLYFFFWETYSINRYIYDNDGQHDDKLFLLHILNAQFFSKKYVLNQIFRGLLYISFQEDLSLSHHVLKLQNVFVAYDLPFRVYMHVLDGNLTIKLKPPFLMQNSVFEVS